jgi:hypothetical protein
MMAVTAAHPPFDIQPNRYAGAGDAAVKLTAAPANAASGPHRWRCFALVSMAVTAA